MSHVLHLHLKGVYFDAIQSGTKTQEFREQNAYWTRILEGPEKKTYSLICIYRGYPKSSDFSRQIWFPWRGFEKTSIIHSHFGAGPTPVYAIHLTHARP